MAPSKQTMLGPLVGALVVLLASCAASARMLDIDEGAAAIGARSLLQTCTRSFPYCRCKAYDPSISPYNLVYNDPGATPAIEAGTGNILLRFNLLEGGFAEPARGWSPVERECVEDLLNRTQSLSINARPECAGEVVRVRVNGQVHGNWRFDRYNQAGTTRSPPFCGAAVKLVNVNFAAPAAFGTVIELAVKPGICASIAGLVPAKVVNGDSVISWSLNDNNKHKCCPTGDSPIPPPLISSPPPPPSPSPPGGGSSGGFPWCACDRGASTPFRFIPTSREPIPDGTRVCGVFDVADCDVSRQCCGRSLSKIEFHVADQCYLKVRSVQFDGQPRGAVFDTQFGPGKTVFKVTKLNLTRAEAQGRELCWSIVDRAGGCTSLEDFCEGPNCRLTTFDPSNDCCPVFTLSKAWGGN